MALRPGPLVPVTKFRPSCTHLTMTRLYGFEFICEACHRPGPFGWVYRCTQDREDIIEHAVGHEHQAAFDDLGELLAAQMIVRKRSPASRADRLSLFNELSTEKLAQYRPDQIATILRQREGVQNSILRDQGRERKDLTNHAIPDDGQRVPFPERQTREPWVPLEDQECRYMICPICRSGAGDRAYLSLDAVANGEVPPTAAVGYGFHVMGERPVVDAEILKTIGCRPAPLFHDSSHLQTDSSGSAVSVMSLLESQLAQSQAFLNGPQGPDINALPSRSSNSTPSPLVKTPGHLKHSPRCENLAAFSHSNGVTNQGSSVRPPWTPPPSPSPYGKQSASEAHAVGLAAEKSISDGRSSNSLKTNQGRRQQMLASVPSNSALQRIAQSDLFYPEQSIPYLEEAEYDVGLTLPFDSTSFNTACLTPLKAPDHAEEVYLNESTNSMVNYETQHGFTPAPLQVDRGVAVLEESVELGVPDVITQA